MSLTKVLLVLVSVLVAANQATDLYRANTEAQRFFNSVPEEDREYFITFHIAIAAGTQNREDVKIKPEDKTLPEELYNQFMNMNPPNNFSNDLLHWVENDFDKISEPLVLATTKSLPVICFENGCVLPSDIGAICCPF